MSAHHIPRAPFGRTGHESSRCIFGAAALGAMRQDKADRLLELLLECGINHLDTAAAYGDSELRIAPWMRRHRDGFFLATKTGERGYQGARDSLHRSLERLGVDRVDLIQLHNLVDEEGWEQAMGAGGALEALIEARDQGLVRFLGVTGHGTRVAAMHSRSLERFPFDSVLLPYNFAMIDQPEYRSDFEALVRTCRERDVAIQTIKSIARRRWQEEPERRFSWYEPLRDPEAIQKAVGWVLSRRGFFLNTSSDATLLPILLEAAARPPAAPGQEEVSALVATHQIEPLFIRGYAEGV